MMIIKIALCSQELGIMVTLLLKRTTLIRKKIVHVEKLWKKSA